MTSTTTATMFDFMNSNSEYNYTIRVNLILNIKYNSPSIARLYFTNNLNNTVDIPTEFKIYTFDYQKGKQRIIQKSVDKQSYSLCWSDNYVLEYNNEILMNISNTRQWVLAK
jgi:hypothetical protein